MKKETWKTVIQVIVSILTAALTALTKRLAALTEVAASFHLFLYV